MNEQTFLCSKISVDCVENDPVDIRCGGPEYLGFDFFVKDEEFGEMQKFIVGTLSSLEIPLISIYESDKMTLHEKDIWTKEKIYNSIVENANDIKNEVKKEKNLSLKNKTRK